jgi:rubrerythrin
MMKMTTLLGALLMLAATSALVAGSDAYHLTREALGQRYVDEVRAHTKYLSYARQACTEGYPNIAHLFLSLGASEAVHARNFQGLLLELGMKPKTPSMKLGGGAVKTTRENLRHATEVERDEIDKEYPAILEHIRPEGHQAAIDNITYAWEAEKQHRDLIVKIQKAAKGYFELLVGRIEGEPTHYHVCRVCGSTLTELPDKVCPICGQPVKHYREVPPFPPAECPEREEPLEE